MLATDSASVHEEIVLASTNEIIIDTDKLMKCNSAIKYVFALI
jgi:hypothetical protein